MRRADKWIIPDSVSFYNAGTENPISVSNSGLTVELIEAPRRQNSSTGRRSYCMCTLSKDGQSTDMPIDMDMMFDTLKESTCINGVFKEAMVLAKKAEATAILHSGMAAYAEAMRDMSLRDTVAKKGTTNKGKAQPIPGNLYKTITKEQVYLGNLYCWLSELPASYMTLEALELKEKSTCAYNLVDYDDLLPKIGSMSSLANLVDDEDDWLRRKARDIIVGTNNGLLTSVGARADYGNVFNADMSLADALEKVKAHEKGILATKIAHLNAQFLATNKSNNDSLRDFESVLCNTVEKLELGGMLLWHFFVTSGDKPQLSREDKALLALMYRTSTRHKLGEHMAEAIGISDFERAQLIQRVTTSNSYYRHRTKAFEVGQAYEIFKVYLDTIK